MNTNIPTLQGDKIHLSLNHEVEFILTESGAQILNEAHAQTNAAIRAAGGSSILREDYKENEVVKEQLWVILHDMGLKLEGTKIPFFLNITVNKDENK